MSRIPILTYDKGSLILHPPPKGKDWIEYAIWDDRIEKFRIPANSYGALVSTLIAGNIEFIDQAKEFFALDLKSNFTLQPYPHQKEALEAWQQANKQGVIVLPTAAGKTYLAQLAMELTPVTTLIIVPTLDLMHQWYAQIESAFPNLKVGLLGGGSKDRTPILISTYHSAAIHAQTLGNNYAFLIFDECHHLPSDFFRVIAEEAIAPYRLGLTATPERGDGSHKDLDILIGKVCYRKTPQDLSGKALSEHQVLQIKVKLSPEEKEKYDQAIKTRNDFLKKANISLSSLNGWQMFIQASAKSSEGRRAMLAHRESKEMAEGNKGKLTVLSELINKHHPDKILIFTNDNATVYRISQEFLIPAITHQTPVKERHFILKCFRENHYNSLVASHVLNEGVDVPSAKIAIILSGTSSNREYIQRLGRILRKSKDGEKLAILYEIIAENTAEENTSKRRKGESTQLEIIKNNQFSYDNKPKKIPILKAAEKSTSWNQNNS